MESISSSYNENFPLTTIAHHVSARKLLLTASSTSSNQTILLQTILPYSIMQKLEDQYLRFCNVFAHLSPSTTPDIIITLLEQQLPMYRFVLILDDLDILLQYEEEDTEKTTPSDSERSSSLYTISRAIDILQSMDQKAIETVTKRKSQNLDFNDSIYKHLPPPFILGLCRCHSSKLPAELARVGRFEKHIEMLPPSEQQREIMLKALLESMLKNSTVPMHLTPRQNTSKYETPSFRHKEASYENIIRQWAKTLAPQTAGCVASDLRRICADAYITAVARQSPPLDLQCHSRIENYVQFEYVNLTWDDVREATRKCIPSQLAKMDISMTRFMGNEEIVESDGSIDVKKRFEIGWKKFSGYNPMKKKIYRTVAGPWIRMSKADTNIYTDDAVPCGVLFHGPSGCGKTLAAHCLASSLGLHIMKVSA